MKLSLEFTVEIIAVNNTVAVNVRGIVVKDVVISNSAVGDV